MRFLLPHFLSTIYYLSSQTHTHDPSRLTLKPSAPQTRQGITPHSRDLLLSNLKAGMVSDSNSSISQTDQTVDAQEFSSLGCFYYLHVKI